LDLRDPDEYDFWRIKESINYPAANIGRDKVIPELFRFKNKANKLIIIYMGDERKGTAAANLMAEKGYENVFLLSGGIEQFNEEFNSLYPYD
jgi:centrosomal protein CEP41